MVDKLKLKHNAAEQSKQNRPNLSFIVAFFSFLLCQYFTDINTEYGPMKSHTLK